MNPMMTFSRAIVGWLTGLSGTKRVLSVKEFYQNIYFSEAVNGSRYKKWAIIRYGINEDKANSIYFCLLP